MRNISNYLLAAAVIGAAEAFLGPQSRREPQPFDVKVDFADQRADSIAVRWDRQELRAALEGYEDSLVMNGKDSILTKSARLRVLQAQLALHTDLGDLKP
jgi:hypothetical protein